MSQIKKIVTLLETLIKESKEEGKKHDVWAMGYRTGLTEAKEIVEGKHARIQE